MQQFNYKKNNNDDIFKKIIFCEVSSIVFERKLLNLKVDGLMYVNANVA